MRQQKRQAMSNILATVVLIGISVSGGGLLLALSTDMIQIQFANESLSITSAEISNTNTESWLTISIKNTGNSQIDELKVVVNGLEEEFIVDFDPTTLTPSKGTSLTVDLEEIIVPGTSVLVVVNGNSTSGGIISEVTTVRP